jgi:hypothetical protein
LRTAIELWFGEGDPVSVHTLAFAAHEIVHFVSKKKIPGRRDLLFDSLVAKDEHRKEWLQHMKKHANFFKHASSDTDETIEFDASIPEFFIMFAILGIQLCGEELGVIESAFLQWICLTRPDLLTERGRSLFQAVPRDQLAVVRNLSKPDFFNY